MYTSTKEACLCSKESKTWQISKKKPQYLHTAEPIELEIWITSSDSHVVLSLITTTSFTFILLPLNLFSCIRGTFIQNISVIAPIDQISQQCILWGWVYENLLWFNRLLISLHYGWFPLLFRGWWSVLFLIQQNFRFDGLENQNISDEASVTPE